MAPSNTQLNSQPSTLRLSAEPPRRSLSLGQRARVRASVCLHNQPPLPQLPNCSKFEVQSWKFKVRLHHRPWKFKVRLLPPTLQRSSAPTIQRRSQPSPVSLPPNTTAPAAPKPSASTSASKPSTLKSPNVAPNSPASPSSILL